ncbi:hypothetical protein TRAPUB_7435 [Trametes pubescens]|uniref:F-box domain-containing protein n=1 Tax=Trametes pubescens TaxID=154538 RepID=A0A1M2V3D7_TRAPU|nr:hypothetical protein TRAPUB_7435 [Trametes pubescens]
MATVDWPALQDLFLGGSFPNKTSDWLAKRLRHMLRRMPHLRHLVIVAALPRHVRVRCCLLSRDPSSSPWQHSLRSLVVAYPDHRDPVFSIPFSDLTYLSLRDWPRHYKTIAPNQRGPWGSPILSATRALSILRRLHAPGLTTLELVYRADEADDELLVLIAQTFTKLRHIELHRYRRSRDESVDHHHIARTLSAAPSLLRLRLHLDFKDDPGEYIDRFGTVSEDELDCDRYEQWRSQLANLGWDILDAMNPCLSLKGVALLDRVRQKASWLWLLRGQKGPREPVRDFSEGNW